MVAQHTIFQCVVPTLLQVEDQQLVDYKGDYEVFLEQNEEEAEKIAAIEEARREVEKSQIKAKSKVCIVGLVAWSHGHHICCADVQGGKGYGEEGKSQAVC